MGDVLIVQVHRDLGDPVVARLAARLRLHLDLLDLARVEDAVELALEQLARLAVQHFEHLAPHGVVARHALGSALAFTVPGTDQVGAVNHVQADWQRINDPPHEVALRLHLPGAQRHLGSQVLRQLGRGDQGRQDLRHHQRHVVGHALRLARGQRDLQQAERRVLVHERKP